MQIIRKNIVFTAKEKAELLEEKMDIELTGDQVLLKLIYDIISTGTELANYRDMPNTSINVNARGGFPRTVGYSFTAEVVEVGPEVKELRIGDKVIVGWGGHRSMIVKREAELIKLPPEADLVDAAFAHIASFPMLAVRKLRLELGESCMVAGLGLLGLFAVQFAKLSGAYPVLACDFSAERRALALELGADYALNPQDKDFIEQVRSLTEGKGPAATVEVTGVLAGLQQALEYTAVMGRIAELGCTRISDEPINIYKYIHGKGINLIGAHTKTRPALQSQPGMWTEKDDYKTFLKLLLAQKINVKPMTNWMVKPQDAQAVFQRLHTEKNPPLGVVIDWQQL